MYLQICGEIEKTTNMYQSKFRPNLYKVNPQIDEVPLFIIIEGLAQIGCRSISRELFNAQSVFPIQFNNLDIEGNLKSVRFDNEELILTSIVHQVGKMGVAQCNLQTKQGKILVKIEVWGSVRVDS